MEPGNNSIQNKKNCENHEKLSSAPKSNRKRKRISPPTNMIPTAVINSNPANLMNFSNRGSKTIVF